MALFDHSPQASSSRVKYASTADEHTSTAFINSGTNASVRLGTPRQDAERFVGRGEPLRGEGFVHDGVRVEIGQPCIECFKPAIHR